MRRRLGRNSRDRRPSPGVVGVGTLALGLLAPAPAGAGDEGPKLSAPVGTGPASPAPAPVPAEAPIPRPILSTPAPRRPVLALPGITTPAAAPAPAQSPAPSLDLELPALDAPKGMNQAPPPARMTLPPPIEALPFEPASGLPELPPTTPRGTPARRTADAPPARSGSTANRPGSSAATSASTTAPARRPWWFGGPARPGMPGAGNASAGRAGLGDGSASRGSDSADPKAEVVLQKKLERQARALVGDRARSVDVRVAGKQVVIEARGVRMFQKRNVRKSLETMPVQGGLRPTVHVFD